jgi:ribosomal protein S18 acetylase RimI-like enzyme
MKKDNIKITKASVKDAGEILKLQKLAYLSEAEIYNDYTIPPLTQTLEELRNDFAESLILKAVVGGKIVGSVRGNINEGCYVGRLMAHPDFQNQRLGTRLMKAIEAEFPKVTRLWLMTGSKSERNIHLYQKLGYNIYKTERQTDKVELVYLEKRVKLFK